MFCIRIPIGFWKYRQVGALVLYTVSNPFTASVMKWKRDPFLNGWRRTLSSRNSNPIGPRVDVHFGIFVHNCYVEVFIHTRNPNEDVFVWRSEKTFFLRLQSPKTKEFIHARVICYLKLNQLPLYYIPTQKSTQPRLGSTGVPNLYQANFSLGWSHRKKSNNKQTNKQEAKLPMMTVRGILYLKKGRAFL